MSDAVSADPGTVDLARYDRILDVRPNAEDRLRIASSIAAPLESLLDDPGAFIPSTDTSILIVCDVGMRSSIAAERLREAGFGGVDSLAGGLDAWRREGRPLVGAGGLTDVELDRFDRQLKVPDIGVSGQQQILASTVTVVGAGGLGVPVVSYLAGAGVGTIRVIDHDAVDRTNLHRQPLYGLADVGRAKTEVAADRLAGISAETKVETFAEVLTESNAADLIAGSDVVVDATDNFDARYAVSDAARSLATPLVTGAVYRWEGQVTTLMPDGPCYRCVFPRSPGSARQLDCAVIGAIGPVVATIGSLQATEALRITAGLPPAYDGTMLMYDGGSGSFVPLGVRRRDDCPACAEAGQSTNAPSGCP